MSTRQQDPKNNRRRSAWDILTQPLFGTQRQSEWVWIEGRLSLSRRQKSAAIAALLLVVLVGAWLTGGQDPVKPLLHKFFGSINNRLCEPGLGGYSSGGEIFLAIFATGSLVCTMLVLILLVDGWRIRKRQRNIPLGYRPWFRQRLIEGQAAVHLGTQKMAVSVIALLGCACMWYLLVVQISQFLLFRPAGIPRCQPPHSLKAALSKPVVPIPEKP